MIKSFICIQFSIYICVTEYMARVSMDFERKQIVVIRFPFEIVIYYKIPPPQKKFFFEK